MVAAHPGIVRLADDRGEAGVGLRLRRMTTSFGAPGRVRRAPDRPRSRRRRGGGGRTINCVSVSTPIYALWPLKRWLLRLRQWRMSGSCTEISRSGATLASNAARCHHARCPGPGCGQHLGRLLQLLVFGTVRHQVSPCPTYHFQQPIGIRHDLGQKPLPSLWVRPVHVRLPFEARPVQQRHLHSQRTTRSAGPPV